MIQSIDHDIRSKLEISAAAYLVADAYAKVKIAGDRITKQELADVIGLSPAQVTLAGKELRAVGLVTDKGLSDLWFKAHSPMMEVNNLTTGVKERTKHFIEYLNQKTGQRLSPTATSYINRMKQVMRKYPEKCSTLHLEALIDFKSEEWTGEMKKYLVPDTLLSVDKGRYESYVDQAISHFKSK